MTASTLPIHHAAVSKHTLVTQPAPSVAAPTDASPAVVTPEQPPTLEPKAAPAWAAIPCHTILPSRRFRRS